MSIGERRMVNDYAMIKNKVSEFLYKPISDVVEGCVLRRDTFKKIRTELFWNRALPLWC